MSLLPQVPKTTRVKVKKLLITTYRRILIRRKIRTLLLLVVEKKIKVIRPPK